MEAEQIQELLRAQIPDSEAQVQVDGGHAYLVVISAEFEGLNTVKKQQRVYAALNQAIADGRIHAVHMKTYTPAEWQAAQA